MFNNADQGLETLHYFRLNRTCSHQNRAEKCVGGSVLALLPIAFAKMQRPLRSTEQPQSHGDRHSEQNFTIRWNFNRSKSNPEAPNARP